MKNVVLILAFVLAVTIANAGTVELEWVLNGVLQRSTLASVGAGSDCAISGSGMSAQIQCPLWDWPVSGTTPIAVACNQFGGILVASGGGTVPIVLPDAPCRGRGSVVQMTTDGLTNFTIAVQTPSKTKIQGVVPVNGAMPVPIPVSAGQSAWAQFNGSSTYNVGLQ